MKSSGAVLETDLQNLVLLKVAAAEPRKAAALLAGKMVETELSGW